MKGFILIISNLITIFYCLQFGYIWSGYGHGGQIIGIPFALIMIALPISYAKAKTPKGKEKVFYASLFYFLTLAFFSLAIELIRVTDPNYFELLYVEPKGIVDKIFLVFLSAGIIATILKFRYISKHEILQ